ncbi:MAG TPA: hypothetical protein P5186_07145 [Candidatus Paceibacterota bacterium]|nr:hypothetical protein [Verrucomicrobiota bacterium]HRY47804.1 hypothetical protein [Candidatus Paceibacterota bacterium]HSA03042.1 hypothetical protein [Candidatus Paceibacterota bacterium]
MENNPLLHYRIWSGVLVFGIGAAIGLRLIYRGIRGDVCDKSGTPMAGPSWFIGGGILCLMPLVAYLVFVWKQGYFAP